MYSDDFKMPKRYAAANKAYVESVINEYNKKMEEKPAKNNVYSESDRIMETVASRQNARNRYNSYSESIRTTLVTEALYNLFKESAPESISSNPSDRSIMRAIVNEYVNDKGYTEILNRMKTASVPMSEMHNIIVNNTKAILEEADKDNPDTFVVTPEMKDNFFDQLNHSDSEDINNAIKERVSDAMEDFVTANTKDHDDIQNALNKAQEEVGETPDDEEELKEYYVYKAKREAAEIRNAPKSILHSMISSMCEGVIRNQDQNREFINEGHLDMDKITNRVSLMYNFLEMLNTTKLEKINSAYLENVIEGLKK